MSDRLSEHPAAGLYRKHYRDMGREAGWCAAMALWGLEESWWRACHGSRDAALRRITDGR